MDINLRPWRPEDLDRLVTLADNIRISGRLTDRFPHPYTREAGENFIEMATSREPVHVLAIELDGEVIGGIGIHPQEDIFRKNAELGYWIGEDYWGRGIMSRAVPKIVDYGFLHFDIDRIFARPFGSNIASRKVLEKCGFVLEARFDKTLFKNGVYEDELVYAIRRPDKTAPSKQIINIEMERKDIQNYHAQLSDQDRKIADTLYGLIVECLPEAKGKVWHGHPVWFIEGNPIVGYSKQKAGMRFMFWSGADFYEPDLSVLGEKFKDASIFYKDVSEIDTEDVGWWLDKSRDIQWDYKNLVKRKGELVRIVPKTFGEEEEKEV